MSPGMRSAEHGQCNRHKACNVVQEDREQVCAGSRLQINNPMDRRREVVRRATHAHKAHGKYVQSVMLKNGRPGRKLPPRRPRQARPAAGSRRCTPARCETHGQQRYRQTRPAGAAVCQIGPAPWAPGATTSDRGPEPIDYSRPHQLPATHGVAFHVVLPVSTQRPTVKTRTKMPTNSAK